MLSFTHQALEKFDNQHDFERMCADILNGLGYRDVVPIAPRGGGDGGRDITYTTSDGEKGLACVTLRSDSDTKFKEDFEQRTRGEYAEYIFFTNQYLTPTQKIKYAKFCVNTLGATFVPKDIEALRSLLDSALQSVRQQFLDIDPDHTPKYEMHIVSLRSYSATKRASDAWAAHQKKYAEFMSQSVVAGRMPISFPTLGVYSTEEVLSSLKNYAEEIDKFNQGLPRVLSFNIVMTSSEPDTNLSVLIQPGDGYKLSFNDALIRPPRKPSSNRYSFLTPELANIPNVNPRDDDEFYARNIGVGVKSNLRSINAAQPKKIMDTTTFIISEAPITVTDRPKLTVTIYSNKLKHPQIEVLELDVSSAEQREI